MCTRASLFVLCIAVGAEAAVAEPPAATIDLNAWKLTLPYDTERSGKPDEVVQPELAKFADPSCFHLSATGDSVIFRASCDGKGTTNSKYPRSELREMTADGDDEASWSTDGDAQHVMEVELAITHVPSKRPHVVCAQIHDEKDDLLMVRLEGNSLFIEREGEDEVELDSNYQLGDKFTLRILASGGAVKVWHNDGLKMDWPISKKKCYFKVGCYTQSNLKREGRSGSYGEVELYRLQVTHH